MALVEKDELAEIIDDIAFLGEHWMRNREKGRIPNAIRRAIIMAAREAIALDDSRTKRVITEERGLLGIKEFINGMTVAELKAIVKDWPETNDEGEPCEVWVCGRTGLSSQITTASSLNYRQGDSGEVWADLILGYDT